MSETLEHTKDGYYSQTACDGFGCACYLDVNGNEVLVTNVVDPGADSGSIQRDLVFVGALHKFVRHEGWGTYGPPSFALSGIR